MNTPEKRLKDRNDAILKVRKILSEPYFVMDTETTDKSEDGGQICELAILRKDGSYFRSYIKPTVPIMQGANRVNHIMPYHLRDAPGIEEVIDEIPTGICAVFYNAPYDVQALKNSLIAKDKWFDVHSWKCIYDIMLIYAAFDGRWNNKYDSYRYHQLSKSCQECGIQLDCSAHNALSDVLMTDSLMKYMAEQELENMEQ